MGMFHIKVGMIPYTRNDTDSLMDICTKYKMVEVYYLRSYNSVHSCNCM